MVRLRIRVTGTVQGVGFRPFVYREAQRLGLAGWVRNDDAGVLIEAEGVTAAADRLVHALRDRPPRLARVEAVSTERVPTVGEGTFSIVGSARAHTEMRAPVAVDSATCAECLAEVDDPDNRRHRYPFTNCTNCGPRYTIVRAVPYDRATTTMAGFAMCTACQREFDDPRDRRFHAQPNACPRCGPQLRWGDLVGAAALDAATTALRAGLIVAVKGIGGFHLAADATNAAAVAGLRARKARDDKPFAVMVADVATARSLCDLDEAAVGALTSPARPIVLAPRRADAAVVPAVAPGVSDLGVLLAYSPLHHLLLRDVGAPLVMTSGNRSDEPIAYDDVDASARLHDIADGVLGHDRPIHVRCDDSVVQSDSRRAWVTTLRRSRGFAPEPMPLPIAVARPVLAVGGELKNTVALARGRSVVASHHIGDLEHLAAYESFRDAIRHLEAVFHTRPEVVAHDLHPEYLSTKFALDSGLPALAVQHHHAHVAACLVDHGRAERVVGVAFDGLGYGPDATLWGGEFLIADLTRYTRAGHLAPVTLPGGTAAIREPWRMGVAWAQRAGVSHPFGDDGRADAVADLAARGVGPTTTSAGRLFDAVAALLGVRRTVSFEGQAAMELEALASRVASDDAPAYPLDVRVGTDGVRVVDPAPLVAAVVASGETAAVRAAGFHRALGETTASVAAELARTNDLRTVVLTGGVFQNRRLTQVVTGALAAAGLEVLTHRHVPPNDGGLSIGQAAVAAAQLEAAR